MLATLLTRGGSQGMLPQKYFEILGVTRCFQRHFGDNFQMSYFYVNTCSGSKFLVDIKLQGKNIFGWSKSGGAMPPLLEKWGVL